MAGIREKLILTVSVLVLLLAGFFTFKFFNSKKSSLNQAKNYIREYKIAKAIEILNNLKLKSANKDSDLEFLIFYALIKAKKYEDSEKQLDDIEFISRKYRESFNELVDFLNINNKVALLNKLISKAHKLRLDEDFFIELSSHRNDLNSEMTVLTGGLSYLRNLIVFLREKKKNIKKQISTSKLENYILRRCIDSAHIYLGSKDYKSALYYLNRAKNLNVVDSDPLKDDYYYDLAVTYRHLGKYDQAWDNMQLSAKLGNERAKADLRSINSKYQPQG